MESSIKRINESSMRASGVGLIEYAVIGSSILLVCLFVLVSVGGNLNDWMVGLKGDMQNQISHTKNSVTTTTDRAPVVSERGETASYIPPATSGSGATTTATGPDSLCGPDWCINAPGLTGDTVSTAGSNGDQKIVLTHNAAEVYAQLAKIIEANGEMDESIRTLLTTLALEGHRLGDYQTQFRAGSTYDYTKAGMEGMYDGVENFKRLSMQLEASLDRVPPSMRAVLQDAAHVIISIGDSYSYTGIKNGERTDDLGWSAPTEIKIELTHANANTICTNGGKPPECIK